MDQRPTSTAATPAAATTLLAILAAAGTFTWLGPVLRPLLLAMFVFYAIRSAARWLARLGLGFTAASICLLSLAGIFTILLTQLVHRETGAFLAKWPRYEQRIDQLLDRLPVPVGLRPATDAAAPRAPAPSPQRGTGRPPQSAGVPATPAVATPDPAAEGDAAGGQDGPVVPAEEPPSLLRDLVGGGSKAAVDFVFRRGLSAAELLVLVIVYTIFLSLGWRRLSARVVRAFPGEQGRRLLAIGDGIGTSMEKFMTVKTLVGAGMAATAGLIMAVFRVDHWLLWTYLFFVANFVTSIGSVAACVPPIVMAFLGLPSTAAAVVVTLLLIVNRCAWIDFVEVRLAGRELSLDPVVVLLWLTYWGWAWGVIGLLLAYPMLAALKIVLLHIRGCEGWATLLGDE